MPWGRASVCGVVLKEGFPKEVISEPFLKYNEELARQRFGLEERVAEEQTIPVCAKALWLEGL